MKKLLFTALCLYGLSAPALAERLDFDVYLDDQKVGSNTVNIQQNGADTQVSVKSVFNVKVLFINAYHYSHTAQERWRNGCLVQLDTRTNDNGKQQTVSTTQVGNILKVAAGANSADLPGCVRSFAYWNPALLNSSHLINTQTGKYEPARLSLLDNQPLVFNSKAYGSKHYRLQISGNTQIDLWYDQNNSWQALQARVQGRELRYLRKGAGI